MEENKTVDNIGNLVISEDVIASIALNAAKDVEGVSSFAARTVTWPPMPARRMLSMGVLLNH